MAARQIATVKQLSMSENARALALIMMGSNDSLIASFYNKYHHNLWRPETAIHAGLMDGNAKTLGTRATRRLRALKAAILIQRCHSRPELAMHNISVKRHMVNVDTPPASRVVEPIPPMLK